MLVANRITTSLREMNELASKLFKTFFRSKKSFLSSEIELVEVSEISENPSIHKKTLLYNILDYTRGAGGPQGLVSNHLKSGGNEDGGNLLKRISDVRFSCLTRL